MMIGRIFKVYGKVQNVGFRFYTHKTALKYKIKGFVKNEADGSVYIEAEGEALNMIAFESWCKQGPSWARVKEVKSFEQAPFNFTEFLIK
jgi:acylphosphatase